MGERTDRSKCALPSDWRVQEGGTTYAGDKIPWWRGKTCLPGSKQSHSKNCTAMQEAGSEFPIAGNNQVEIQTGEIGEEICFG